MSFDINTPYAPANVDQLAVNGIVNINGSALTFGGAGGTAPAVPSFLVVIANDSWRGPVVRVERQDTPALVVPGFLGTAIASSRTEAIERVHEVTCSSPVKAVQS